MGCVSCLPILVFQELLGDKDRVKYHAQDWPQQDITDLALASTSPVLTVVLSHRIFSSVGGKVRLARVLT